MVPKHVHKCQIQVPGSRAKLFDSSVKVPDWMLGRFLWLCWLFLWAIKLISVVSLPSVVCGEMINADLLALTVFSLWHTVLEIIRDRAVKTCFMELAQHLENDSQLCSCCLTALMLLNAVGSQALQPYRTWSAIVKCLVLHCYILLGFLHNSWGYSEFDSLLLTLNWTFNLVLMGKNRR